MFPFPNMMCAGSAPSVWRWATADASVTLSNGNRTAAVTGSPSGGGAGGVLSGSFSGKLYVELQIDSQHSANAASLGVSNGTTPLHGQTWVGQDAGSCGWNNSQVTTNGASTSLGASMTTGDLIGIACDLPNKKVWFAKNGVWISGNPSTGSGGFSFAFTPSVVIAMPGALESPNDAISIPILYSYPPPDGFALR